MTLAEMLAGMTGTGSMAGQSNPVNLPEPPMANMNFLQEITADLQRNPGNYTMQDRAAVINAVTNARLADKQGAAMDRLNQPMGKWAQGFQTFGTVTKGLSDLTSIWTGLQGLKLQKDAFNFNKGVTNTNLNNSIMDYNRRLTDTLNNRALNNGQGQGWVSSQLAQYSAKRS